MIKPKLICLIPLFICVTIIQIKRVNCLPQKSNPAQQLSPREEEPPNDSSSLQPPPAEGYDYDNSTDSNSTAEYEYYETNDTTGGDNSTAEYYYYDYDNSTGADNSSTTLMQEELTTEQVNDEMLQQAQPPPQPEYANPTTKHTERFQPQTRPPVERAQQFVSQKPLIDKPQQFVQQKPPINKPQQFTPQKPPIDKPQQIIQQKHPIDKPHTDKAQQFINQKPPIDKPQQIIHQSKPTSFPNQQPVPQTPPANPLSSLIGGKNPLNAILKPDPNALPIDKAREISQNVQKNDLVASQRGLSTKRAVDKPIPAVKPTHPSVAHTHATIAEVQTEHIVTPNTVSELNDNAPGNGNKRAKYQKPQPTTKKPRPTLAPVQPKPDDIGKKAKEVSATQQKTPSDPLNVDCLAAHNAFRKKHRVPPFQLDAKLVEVAEQRAKALRVTDKLAHDFEISYGENLHSRKNAKTIACDIVVKSWYAEIKDYNFESPKLVPENLHFAQIMWKSTTHVGCAQGYSEKSRKIYTVCNYNPEGNVVGEELQQILRPS